MQICDIQGAKILTKSYQMGVRSSQNDALTQLFTSTKFFRAFLAKRVFGVVTEIAEGYISSAACLLKNYQNGFEA